MSGGHFDYYQYHIDDIIASIEREIERATCERPPIVRELRVCVSGSIGGWCRYHPHWQGFLSVGQKGDSKIWKFNSCHLNWQRN